MKLHNCTDEELSKFYKIKDSMKNDYENNKKYLKCFDHTKFVLSGNFASEIVNRMKFTMKIKP